MLNEKQQNALMVGKIITTMGVTVVFVVATPLILTLGALHGLFYTWVELWWDDFIGDTWDRE